MVAVRAGRGLAIWSSIRILHDAVAHPRCAAAHHHGDQRAAVAMHGRQEIEPGGPRVAGLDSVDAVDAAEQVIVIADDLAGVVELSGREVT